MTNKEIINTLREMGFKANYKNVLISTYEEKGYITVIQNKTEMYIVTKEMLENKTNKKRYFNKIKKRPVPKKTT